MVNNGNVCRVINNKDSSRTQSFNYDPLNRLTWASSGSWAQNYSNDIWGNLYKKTVGGTVTPPDTGLDLTIQGVSSINSKNQADKFWCYDAAGNTPSASYG